MEIKHTLIVDGESETYKLDDYPASIVFNKSRRTFKVEVEGEIPNAAAYALGNILVFLALEHGRKM
jgi:hypothetical protein